MLTRTTSGTNKGAEEPIDTTPKELRPHTACFFQVSVSALLYKYCVRHDVLRGVYHASTYCAVVLIMYHPRPPFLVPILQKELANAIVACDGVREAKVESRSCKEFLRDMLVVQGAVKTPGAELEDLLARCGDVLNMFWGR